jgi:hypothetical protein
MAQTAVTTPEDQIAALERYAAAGDLANMMQVIGDLHENWNRLGVDAQDDVRRLEAIFLSMLKAKTKAGAEA